MSGRPASVHHRRAFLASPDRRRRRKAVAAVVSAISLAAWAVAGCGQSEERSLGSRDLERTMVDAMDRRLEGLEVSRVRCIALTPALTRCYARGQGPEGPFRLPVSVERREGEPVWLVAEEDLQAARRGAASDPLTVGETVLVEGPEGQAVQVRVGRRIAPLEVPRPDVRPEYGSRYVKVPMSFRNKGDRPYLDSPLSRVSATLSDGSLVRAVPLTHSRCAPRELIGLELDPGERIRGCVAFRVPIGLSLDQIAVQLRYRERVIEWDVEPAMEDVPAQRPAGA